MNLIELYLSRVLFNNIEERLVDAVDFATVNYMRRHKQGNFYTIIIHLKSYKGTEIRDEFAAMFEKGKRLTELSIPYQNRTMTIVKPILVPERENAEKSLVGYDKYERPITIKLLAYEVNISRC